MANAYTDSNGVFKNLLGQTEAQALQVAEYGFPTARSIEILGGHVQLEAHGFGLQRLAVIHRHLFRMFYEWSGKVRTVPSSKRAELGGVTRFAEPDAIVKDWQALEPQTQGFAEARQFSFEDKCKALALIFIEANRIHPFPEGNGRSLQVFMQELALVQGVKLNYAKVSAREWNAASAVSGTHGRLFEGMHSASPEPIRRVFKAIGRDGALHCFVPSEPNTDKNVLRRRGD
ncbi:Fic family protein (plasmid) [Acidovorax sp. DW039]|uniref:Fic/DOC family protein n=1 Tax=Acidovorax sp. DW039 TaxID=3095606 RepID=UPI00309210C6|nr:Fic family protein [Acidovorax sp. DW039]